MEGAQNAARTIMGACRVDPPPGSDLPRPKGNSLVFDTESTGLPSFGRYEENKPHLLDKYEYCRLVSIAWRVLGPMPELATLRQGYHIVRPEYDFDSVEGALNVHGITHEMALRDGQPLAEVLTRILQDMRDCETVVAHNTVFDVGLLLSELFRLHRYDDIAAVSALQPVCTMRHSPVGRRKLADAYNDLTGQILQNAHNAEADTAACADCYVALLRRLPPVAASE